MTSRILTAMVAVATLAVVAFFVPAASAIRSAQERGDLLALQREASIVAARVPATGQIDETMLASVAATTHRFGLYGPDGRLIGGTGPDGGDRIVLEALAGSFAEGRVGDDLVAAVPVRGRDGGSSLILRIEAPRSEGRGRFVDSLLKLAAAAAMVVGVAGGVGIWLARRLNRPIDELRRWAAAADDSDPPALTGITEIDSLRADLLVGRHSIDDLLIRERSFSSHVSHQLRTPVAGMRIAIETELGVPRPDPTTVLRESLDQLDRLESTIGSLLALARHDVRPVADIELLDFVRGRASRWQAVVGRQDRGIVVDGQPTTVATDPEALGQIVDVLLDNAFRHGSGAIHVVVRRLDDATVIDVSDRGSAPRRSDCFGDLVTDPGHGIGLRLARLLAELTGGRLELLDSATTTFRLRLPIVPPGDVGAKF